MKILITKNLENLLQTKWTEILDTQQLMRLCLEIARNNTYPTLQQDTLPPLKVKMSVTKFQITNNEFEMWLEFTVPKNNGIIVGTHIFSLNLNGEIKLKESYGSSLVSCLNQGECPKVCT